jgi:VIT1/CCC1 family predicted Fe2+/Mn2+ transporter
LEGILTPPRCQDACFIPKFCYLQLINRQSVFSIRYSVFGRSDYTWDSLILPSGVLHSTEYRLPLTDLPTQMSEEQHFQSSAIVRDFVIGMSDGLTVPFALAAGLSGAIDSNSIVITAGLSEIAAGSIAMGLGGYLAGNTEIEHYETEEKREYEEIERLHEVEIRETKEIFAQYGISEELQEKIAREMAKKPKEWVDFMMRFELGLERPDKNRARQSALVIGFSYIVGGLIPLSAYFFTKTAHKGLIYSSIITLICLVLFGLVKSKFTGQPLLKGAFKVTVVGALAAAVAYALAKMIS